MSNELEKCPKHIKNLYQEKTKGIIHTLQTFESALHLAYLRGKQESGTCTPQLVEEFRKYFQHQVDVGWILLADNPDELFDKLSRPREG